MYCFDKTVIILKAIRLIRLSASMVAEQTDLINRWRSSSETVSTAATPAVDHAIEKMQRHGGWLSTLNLICKIFLI